jgi:hypothetical protein
MNGPLHCPVRLEQLALVGFGVGVPLGRFPESFERVLAQTLLDLSEGLDDVVDAIHDVPKITDGAGYARAPGLRRRKELTWVVPRASG